MEDIWQRLGKGKSDNEMDIVNNILKQIFLLIFKYFWIDY